MYEAHEFLKRCQLSVIIVGVLMTTGMLIPVSMGFHGFISVFVVCLICVCVSLPMVLTKTKMRSPGSGIHARWCAVDGFESSLLAMQQSSVRGAA